MIVLQLSIVKTSFGKSLAIGKFQEMIVREGYRKRLIGNLVLERLSILSSKKLRKNSKRNSHGNPSQKKLLQLKKNLKHNNKKIITIKVILLKSQKRFKSSRSQKRFK